MKNDLNYIKKLLKILETGEIKEIEIEEEGTRVRVVKSKASDSQPAHMITYSAPPQMMAPQQSAPAAPAAQAPQPKAEEKKEVPAAPPGKDLIEVRSPIVGTFYRAPSPNADPYVQVGQQVSKGNVLCIIEAMKLMNEIECEFEGKVVKMMVDNGQPVEYNQVLFLIEPNN